MMIVIPSVAHSFDLLSSVSFVAPSLTSGIEQTQITHWGALIHDDFNNLSSMSSYSLVQHGTMMTSLPLYDVTKRLQRIGENAFAAALVIAFLQACVALYQYRSNPRGELIVPPGLTWGVENPTDARIPSYTEGADYSMDGGKEAVTMGNSPTFAKANINEEEGATGDKSMQNMWTRPLSRLNKWLFLLMPWMSRQVNFIMQRNSHLFHIGFIMSLASLFGIRRPQFQTSSQADASKWRLDLHKTSGGNNSQKVVVIGDSLAVGLGCSNVFDTNKNSTTPIMRLEVLSGPSGMDSKKIDNERGPAFPQVFARTLSQRLNCRVFWRSAGVDGGSVEDIEHYCLGVVQEEAEKGHPPDFVVLLCGMNDLKTFVGNPFQSSSSVAFQGKLMGLINEIRQFAPNCKIVLPALPIQMFHRNSILNIFPLALFLDAIVGFWDAQKKRVAEMAPSYTMYVGLSAADIFEWYKKSNGDDTTLIAADGIHPNRRCYSYWAKDVGNKLAEKLESGAVAKSV